MPLIEWGRAPILLALAFMLAGAPIAMADHVTPGEAGQTKVSLYDNTNNGWNVTTNDPVTGGPDPVIGFVNGAGVGAGGVEFGDNSTLTGRPGRLDAEMMHEAAQRLVGRHDFTSFRGALCQARSPVKTLAQMTAMRVGERIEIAARARSFLHHQVRNMVGTLKLVGEGRWPVERIEAALAACDRAAAGPTAPACGLYLMRVDYEAQGGDAPGVTSDDRPTD